MQINIQVDVTNTGVRSGQEVVQLYLRDIESSLVRPQKELKAFVKIKLEPGQTRTVSLALQEQDLAFYDDAQNIWLTEPGEFEVLIGRSASDIRVTGKFNWRADA